MDILLQLADQQWSKMFEHFYNHYLFSFVNVGTKEKGSGQMVSSDK